MKAAGILKRVDVFSDLTDEEIRKVAKIASMREYENNEMIVKAGDEGDSIFIINRGAVRVSRADLKGGEEFLALLGEGEHFGEISILDRQPRSADITANEKSELIEIGADEMVRLLSGDAEMAAKIYRVFALTLCNRLRESNENMLLIKNFK